MIKIIIIRDNQCIEEETNDLLIDFLDTLLKKFVVKVVEIYTSDTFARKEQLEKYYKKVKSERENNSETQRVIFLFSDSDKNLYKEFEKYILFVNNTINSQYTNFERYLTPEEFKKVFLDRKKVQIQIQTQIRSEMKEKHHKQTPMKITACNFNENRQSKWSRESTKICVSQNEFARKPDFPNIKDFSDTGSNPNEKRINTNVITNFEKETPNDKNKVVVFFIGNITDEDVVPVNSFCAQNAINFYKRNIRLEIMKLNDVKKIKKCSNDYFYAITSDRKMKNFKKNESFEKNESKLPEGVELIATENLLDWEFNI